MDKKEQQYLMDQLAEETFKKDVDEFSYKRVEALVQLMEVNEPTDSKEAEEAQKKFEKKFEKMTAKKRRINVQKLARIAAVICILILGVNFTTEALMNDNIFHIIQRWGNRYSLLPPDNDLPHEEFATVIFEDVESFDESFDDDFLVASWMPKGYQLGYIKYVKKDNYNQYLWCYLNHDNYPILINMFDKNTKEIGSLVGTDLNNVDSFILNNNMKTYICPNDDVYIACFEYEYWWYTVQVDNKNDLFQIIEGMKKNE